ncbi:hypothetical protein NN561_009912 [Cricetulus griseus]
MRAGPSDAAGPFLAGVQEPLPALHPQAAGRCSPLPAACRGGPGSLAFSLPHARVPFPGSPRDPASGEGAGDLAPHRPRLARLSGRGWATLAPGLGGALTWPLEAPTCGAPRERGFACRAVGG